jgi:hypothetical protein
LHNEIREGLDVPFGIRRRRKKSVIYDIQCAADATHNFNREFTIEEGTEESYTTDMHVTCPFCDTLMTVVVKGKVFPDATIYRKLKQEGV